MNWQNLLSSLTASGLTLTDIARAVDAPLSTISDLSRGASHEPRGALALKLFQLHALRMNPPAGGSP